MKSKEAQMEGKMEGKSRTTISYEAKRKQNIRNIIKYNKTFVYSSEC